MLRVNLSTSETLAFDLEVEDDARRWEEAQARPDFQARIRGIRIAIRPEGKDMVVFACPRPSGRFRIVTWMVELIRDGKGRVVREVVHCYADKVQITMNVYRRRRPPHQCTVDLKRPGRRVLLPPTR